MFSLAESIPLTWGGGGGGHGGGAEQHAEGGGPPPAQQVDAEDGEGVRRELYRRAHHEGHVELEPAEVRCHC